jgi:Domain of unknown function (DUF4835)
MKAKLLAEEKSMKWLALLIMFMSFSTVTAQEINSTVTVNYDALGGTDRETVINLAPAIQNYINSYRWTGQDFRGPKIQVTLNIYLQSGSNGVYSAQAFIGSQRPIYKSGNVSPMVRVLDNSWQFSYTKDQPLLHDEFHFNSFTGFIDYYMYVVLGFDFDSYDPLGGTKYFQKAANIVAQAQNGDFPQGWQPTTSGSYSRYALVNDALSGKYDVFRTAFYNYEYNGIDMLSTQRDSAQVVIANALNKIADIVLQSGSRSALMRVFFDAKYNEIADALNGYPDKGILQKLSIVDQAHQSTYSKYMN